MGERKVKGEVGEKEKTKKNCSQVPDSVTRVAKLNKSNNIIC